jgi:hypothetical protein
VALREQSAQTKASSLAPTPRLGSAVEDRPPATPRLSAAEAMSKPIGGAAEPPPAIEAVSTVAVPSPEMPAGGVAALLASPAAAKAPIDTSTARSVEAEPVAAAPSTPAVAAVSTEAAAAAMEEPAPTEASAPSPTSEPAAATPAPVALREQSARTKASSLAPTPRLGSAVEDRPPATPRLSAAALVARGDGLFGAGDVASARLFYERAVDAGDGQAALRLGETFDPTFLEQAHLRHVQANFDTALSWYRRARDLGVRDAEIFLERAASK